MAFLAGDVKVMVNNVNLSDQAFSVDIPQEKDQVDVSTFSPTGARNFLPGIMDQTITVGFRQNFAAGKVHATIEPLFRGGSSFPIFVQPDSDAGTSATNPIYGGTAQCFSYNGLGAELNDSVDIEVEFKPAPGATFTWGTAWPLS